MKILVAICVGLGVGLSAIADPLPPAPMPTPVIYSDFTVVYALEDNPAIVTGAWQFVHLDGLVATGTWRYAEEAVWPLFTWEGNRYAEETGSNGLLVVHWDLALTQTRLVQSHRNGHKEGLIAEFFRDGSPMLIGVVQSNSIHDEVWWHRNGRLKAIDPLGLPAAGWHSNGVPAYLERGLKCLQWGEDGQPERPFPPEFRSGPPREDRTGPRQLPPADGEKSQSRPPNKTSGGDVQ